MIGYSESWHIEGLPAKPVFTRDDVRGSATIESMQGRTQYTTEFVSADGDEVRGTYVRDGTRRGRFVMRRTREVIMLGSKRHKRLEEQRKRDDR